MRLVNYPFGLCITSFEALNGPAVISSGSTTSQSGFNQSFADPNFAWKFNLSFQSMNFKLARSHRAWVMSQHGGANATRYTLIDGDLPSPEELGLDPATLSPQWGNDVQWDGNATWGAVYPLVKMDKAYSKGETVIELPNNLWGRKLDVGTYIGFNPDYFGFHMITEVLANGQYRIFPPLRKGVTTDNYATLNPTIAMKMENANSADVSRNALFVDGASITLIEVLDEYVREFYTD